MKAQPQSRNARKRARRLPVRILHAAEIERGRLARGLAVPQDRTKAAIVPCGSIIPVLVKPAARITGNMAIRFPLHNEVAKGIDPHAAGMHIQRNVTRHHPAVARVAVAARRAMTAVAQPYVVKETLGTVPPAQDQSALATRKSADAQSLCGHGCRDRNARWCP